MYRDKYPRLWLAWYATETLNTWGDPAVTYGRPPVPEGWDLWGWQYSQSGRVPGYNGNLDLNIIYGGNDMPLNNDDVEAVVHALLVKPIGDAYNGELGRPKVTVSDLLIKLWQYDMEGVSKGRPAGLGFLTMEAVKNLTAEVAAIPAGEVGSVTPVPAPVLADKYEVVLKKVDPS